jgi:hypothetical protein
MHIYTGYVYIWYDTIAKLFYIGGHFGKVTDRYVCSSKAMKRAYTSRPETFKFRVLEYCNGSTKDLRELEQKWLNMIKNSELLLSANVKNNTHRYYNVKKNSCGGNGVGTNKGKPNGGGWNKGIKSCIVVSKETRERMSNSRKKWWADKNYRCNIDL